MSDTVELEIIDINDEARGVAKKDRLIYFVKDAILGELALCKVDKMKKNYAFATKLKILKESPFLQESFCPYYKICDGCSFQDIVYKKQVDYKKNKIINQLNRLANENLTDIDFFEAEERYGYRNKLELKVDIYGKLSYFSRKTNENIAISKCLIGNEKINHVIKLIQEKIDKNNLMGYDPRRNRGLIKNVMIRSTSLGDVMLVFVLSREENMDEFFKGLEKSMLINSCYTSINSKKNNYKIIRPKLVFGDQKIRERLGNQDFLISPLSFLQVNTQMSYRIYLKARQYIEKIKPDLLIDLYSGISTTSILFSDLVNKIISVEIVEDAIKDAKENAKLNQVENISWINEAAEIAIDKINLEQKKSLALFDPPRKGLDPKIIGKTGQSKIDNIVYISCNPATLARDVKLLKGYGFMLKEVTGADMFVNTLHVETVAFLTRQKPFEK